MLQHAPPRRHAEEEIRLCCGTAGTEAPRERSEASFGESYLGGDSADYDAIKVADGYVIGATDGGLAAWQDLWNQANAGFSSLSAYYRAQGLNPDGSRNPAYPVLLDADNLIDYMIVILYGGNLDAPISAFLGNNAPNNWYGIRDSTGDRGFTFFAHDAEHTLLNVNENRNGPWPAGDTIDRSSPQWIHQQLMYNAEYRLRFADRVQKYFFNDGLMTPAKATERFLARADELGTAIIAESARWGDAKREPPLTKTDWQNTVNNIVNNYFPYRSDIVLNQFRSTVLRDGSSAPLYPSVVAPSFNRHGGEVVDGFLLSMAAPAGTLYYTLDGSDPRLVGGAVSPNAIAYTGPVELDASVHVKARVLSGGAWSALDEATFLVGGEADVVISEIMYHPSSGNTAEEYIELYNASSAAVSTVGWQLTKGVMFSLPNGALGPGEYLVVAANVTAFKAKYPTVTNVVGGWTGELANTGETIELVNASGKVLDSVEYSDEGEWSVRTRGPLDHGHQGWIWSNDHDGGGKSLELIQPLLSNNYGLNWGASTAVHGTPGAANSIASTDIAPLILDIAALPVVPRSTEPVTVTARILDELGTQATVTLWHRVDGGGGFAADTMYDDGKHGDGAAGDGVYGATLAAQPDHTIVEFYIQASDAGAHSRTVPGPSQPSGQQLTNLLYQVDDSYDLSAAWTPGSQPQYLLIMTAAERAELALIGAQTDGQEDSNAEMNGTFIALDGTGVSVRYSVGIRNSGHDTRSGPPNNYHVTLPGDDPWNGAVGLTINSRITHSEAIGSAVYRLAGLVASASTPTQVRVNGADLATYPGMNGSYVTLEDLDAAYIAAYFPGDASGNLYHAFATVPPLPAEEADLRYEGASGASYADTYLKATNAEANSYADLIHMLDVLNNAPQATYLQDVSQVIVLDQWLHYLALDALLLDAGSGLDAGIGDDYSLYAGVTDPRFILIPHDLDALMNQGGSTLPVAHSIFTFTGVDGLNRLLSHPDVQPLYYQAILDVIATTFNPQVMDPLIDQVLGGWVASGTLDAMKQFVTDRTNAVLAQIPHDLTIVSSLTASNGYLYTASGSTMLTGTADAARVRSVLVNGLPAAWNARTGAWSIGQVTGSVATTIVPRGSAWRYLDNGSDQGVAWRAPAFNDSAWAAGNAHLGYGDGDEATVVSYGPDPNNKYITTYFRKTFDVTNPSQYTGMKVRVVRDDGIAVYLNGTEIVRNNLAAGAAYNTLALANVGGADETTFYEFTVDPSLLIAGSNVLAVEIHQSLVNSSDISFDLELEVSRPTGGTGVPLQPGINRVSVEAFDGPNGTGNVVQSGVIEIWSDPALATALSGTISVDTILAAASGPYRVTGDLTVAAGVTLTIQPGTTLFFDAGTGLTVNGRLVAEGAEHGLIRLTRVPGGGNWDGVQFADTMADNRLAYAVIEYGVSDGGMVGVTNSRLTVDHVTFDHTDRLRIRAVNSSLVVRDSTFTDLFGPGVPPTTEGLGEHIWASGIASGGEFLIEGNSFGLLKGENAAITYEGGSRPGPIARILDNTFAGGGASALKLEGDAHIEGNAFSQFHKDEYNDEPGHAAVISADDGYDYVVVCNVFYDVDHAALVTDDAFLTFVNNTVVGADFAAITFAVPGESDDPGRGAYVDGVIFADTPVAFDQVQPTTDLVVNRSVVPAADLGRGVGNTSEAPRVADPAGGDFGLLPGSPALGAGPNGLDMGAVVAAGASISGEPSALTGQTSATLIVSGPGITHYRYSVNGGAWSPETPVATPVQLASLANAGYSVRVIGKDSAGVWQAEGDAAVSLSWTVNATLRRVRINEVLAINQAAVEHAGTYPDLVELVNDGAVPVTLDGMSLSDDPANPAKFVFPAGTVLLPGEFLVLYADSDAAAPGLHLGFSLDGKGEGVWLYDAPANGGTLLDSVQFGVQLPDRSIGRVGHDGGWALAEPTFGAANVAQRTGDSSTLTINEWLADGDVLFPNDFIELYNPDPLPVALGGLYLSDRPATTPGRHEITALSFAPGGGCIAFEADGGAGADATHLSFRIAPEHDLIGLFDAGLDPIDVILYSSQTSDVSQGRDPDGARPFAFYTIPTPGLLNSTPLPANILSLMADLRITEIMYDPRGGGDYEFIEFHNTGAAALDLTGLRLGGGIDFEFPSVSLGAGGYIVVVNDLVAFTERYGAGVPVAGEFSRDLGNGGDDIRLVLPEPYEAAILAFAYDGAWYDAADGGGHSLVVRDASKPRGSWGLRESWRPSLFIDGSPGAPDTGGAAGTVAINEIHYDPVVKTDRLEFVEVYNSGAADVALSGWSFTSGISFTFPAGATLPAYGYVVVAQDVAAFQAEFGFAPFGPFTGQLSNGGEKLVLRNAAGQMVDEVDYNAGFPWPVVGTSPAQSIELLNPVLDNNQGPHWRPSLASGPTPGAINSVYAASFAPFIYDVDNSPNSPEPGEAVAVTALVADADGVASVALLYQLVDPGSYIALTDPAYATNWTSLAMHDDGLGVDEVAGDGIYSAELPAALQTHRRLVRYRVTATDALANATTAPFAEDTQPNFAYFVYGSTPSWQGAIEPGSPDPDKAAVVTYDGTVLDSLPTYQLITKASDVQDAQWLDQYSGDDYPWLGTLVYDGKVYDHVRYRAGGDAWRYAMGKNAWELDFNLAHGFQADDNYGDNYSESWDTLTLSSVIQRGDLGARGEEGLFEAVTYRLLNLAGVAAPNTTFSQLRVIDAAAEAGATQYDGDFWGLYLAIEPLGGDFLDEHGLADGNLYDIRGTTGDLLNQGSTAATDKSDLNAFVAAYTGSSPTDAWWRANFGLDGYYSFRAIVEGTHLYDIGDGGNYLYYRDPASGRWSILPEAADLTWADTMPGDGEEPFVSRVLSRPAFALEYGNRVRELRDLLFNTDQAGQLIDEVAAFIYTAGEASFVDADRAMWDYNPILASAYVDPAKAGQGLFYASSPTGDFAGMIQAMKDYVATRAAWLDTHVLTDPLVPDTPAITSLSAPGFPVDQLAFQSSAFTGSGSFAAMEWRLAEVTDPDDVDPDKPRHYEIDPIWESGELTTYQSDIAVPVGAVEAGHTYRVRVRMRDSAGRWSHWSDPIEFKADEQSDPLASQLRVTEIMYHPQNPPQGAFTLQDDYEFIELRNIGAQPIDLQGVRFTSGISFTFPQLQLPAGGYVVVVSDLEAFASRYDTAGMLIAGQFDGQLSNAGEGLRLEGASGQRIAEFDYQDDWFPITDGDGFSLTAVDPAGDLAAWDTAAGWRPSTLAGGSPGADDAGLAPGSVVINELLAHTDQPLGDWIELRNTTGTAINIGGWFLSDDPNNPAKYQIASGTTIPAGGYVSLTQFAQFDNPAAPGSLVQFAFSELGEVACLTSGDGVNEERLGGYRESVEFGASDREVTFGRYTTSTGDVDFVPLSAATRGDANAGPLVGPIVINEIMYHPAAGGHEFIELFNTTGSDVPLYDTTNPTNVWRFDEGISYSFPLGTVLPAGGYLLVVPNDPAAFRAQYGIPAGVQIFGPWAGALDNAGEAIRLSKPGSPEVGGYVPYIQAERIRYNDKAPWPEEADAGGGTNDGYALARKVATAYGNDPANWQASGLGGTPGTANDSLDASPPTATSGLAAAAASSSQINLAWNTAADPQTGIAFYRIYRDGIAVATAPGTSYSDTGLAEAQTYAYRVAAVNGDGIEGPPSSLVNATPKPILQSAYAIDQATVCVGFGKPVQRLSAETLGNYTVRRSGGALVAVSAARLAADGRSVILTLGASLTEGQSNTVTVSNVQDLAGNAILANSQQAFTWLAWQSRDIGSVGAAGSTSIAGGTFTVKGSGADIGGYGDEFRFVYRVLHGNGEIVARVASLTNTDAWAKAGVTFRDSLDPSASHALALVSPGNGSAFQRRLEEGGASRRDAAAGAAPYWVKLVRSGDTFSAYVSANGTAWTLVSQDTVVMGDDAYVGLAVTSRNDGTLATAVFDNVAVRRYDPPSLQLTAPATDLSVDLGQNVTITWTDSDSDDNAAIWLAFDPDGGDEPWEDSDHSWITQALTEDPDGAGDQFLWNVVAIPAGTYTVWGRIDDGINPPVYSRAAGRVTVTNAPNPPTANDDTATVAEDSGPNTIAVLANDTSLPDVPQTLTITAVTQGAHGAVVITGAGTGLTYQPNPNYYGTDSFTYTITDTDGLTDEAVVSLTVTNVADPPTANPDAATIAEDSGPNAINVLANDTWLPDPSELLRITAVTQGAHGTVAITGGGTGLTYQPAANYYGPDSFSYTLEDEDGLTATTTVSVTVTDVADPPVANDDSAIVLEDSGPNAIGVLANDTWLPDPSETLTITAVTQGAHGAVVITGGGTGLTYTPAANYYGPDAFSYTIRDEGGLTASATVSLAVTEVADPPAANDDSVAILEDSGANALDVLANDTYLPDPPETLTITAVTQGAHGTVAITGGGAGLTYTPSTNYYGSDSFTYTIRDEDGITDTAMASVTVTNVADPPVANDDTATIPEDSGPNAIGVLANDTWLPDPAQVLLITGFTAPSHGTVVITGGGTGLTYQPDPNYYGSDSFTYTITDSDGLTDTAAVALTVTNVPDPPAANDDTAMVAEDSGPNAISVLSNDTFLPDPAETLLITAVTQGAHGAVVITGGGTGLTYQPNPNYYGPDSFTYTITDSDGLTDEAVVSLTVTNVADPPAANPDAATIAEDSGPNAINVLSNDTFLPDPPETLLITGFTAPSHGAVVITGGGTGLTYQPVPNYYGADSFTYTITGSDGLTATAGVSVTVTNVADPPVANADTATVAEDSGATAITVLVNDTYLPDPAETLLITGVTQGAHGAVGIAGGGTGLTYQPNANYYGSDSFTYTIMGSDGLTDTAAVAVTVTNVPDPPVANDDAATIPEDSGPNAISVLANDTWLPDPVQTLLITAFTAPSHGTVAITGGGTGLTYQPNPNYYGPDSFTYTITDSDGLTDTAAVAVTVTNVPDPPVANDDTATLAEDSGATAVDVLSNDTFLPDPPETLLITGVTAPSHGTVAITGGGTGLTYQPNPNYYGPDGFTYTITDSDGLTDTAAVAVTVTNVPDPPTANSDSTTLLENSDPTLIDVLSNDTFLPDPPETLLITAVTQGAHGAVNIAGTGVGLTYTPDDGFNGEDSFSYTITGDDGLTATASVSVRVTSVNDAPNFTRGADQTVGEDAGSQVLAGWATGISAGPPDESYQTLTFLVSNDNQGLFSAPPTIAPDGTLSYTPAANANGSATVTVSLKDDGGVEQGGVDASDPQTFLITVSPVNDAPNFLSGADQVVNEDSGPHNVAGWATGISPGPPDEAGQAVTFLVSNDNNALFSVQPSILPDGTLSYTPAANANGVATVTVRAHDDGGAGQGGADTSAPETFTITVNPLNDAPVFQPSFPADPTVLVAGRPLSFDFGATDVDNDPLTYSLVAGPSWLSMDAATGILSGTPMRRADIASSAVTVRVGDGQGGTDDHTFQLTVQGQVIALGPGLPVPLTAVTFTDASGDLVTVSTKSAAGRVYLVRGVAPDAGGAYRNTTAGDLCSIEAEGTNAKSSITIAAKAAVKGLVPRTSVLEIIVTGSLGSLAASTTDLRGNLTVTGGLGKLALGDVAAQHVIAIGSDPLLKPASLVFRRVLDASLTSAMPIASLTVTDWLDQDATPDQITAPWIGKLAVTGRRANPKVGDQGLPGDFEAGLTLSGVGATKSTLGSAVIPGHAAGTAWNVAGLAGKISIARILTSLHFGTLSSLTTSSPLLRETQGGVPVGLIAVETYGGAPLVSRITFSSIAKWPTTAGDQESGGP